MRRPPHPPRPLRHRQPRAALHMRTPALRLPKAAPLAQAQQEVLRECTPQPPRHRRRLQRRARAYLRATHRRRRLHRRTPQAGACGRGKVDECTIPIGDRIVWPCLLRRSSSRRWLPLLPPCPQLLFLHTHHSGLCTLHTHASRLGYRPWEKPDAPGPNQTDIMS